MTENERSAFQSTLYRAVEGIGVAVEPRVMSEDVQAAEVIDGRGQLSASLPAHGAA